MDMSAMAPMRKPSRMPFFTQALTRHPEGDFSSGWAARSSPAFSASLKDWNSAVCAGRYFAGGCSNSCLIFCPSMHLPQQADGFKHSADFFEIFDFGRHERKTPDGLKQAHFSHRGFGWAGIGFDEIDFHEREIDFLQFAGADEIIVEAGVDQGGHFFWNFVGCYGNDAVSAQGDDGQRDGVVAREDRETFGGLAGDCGDLADVAGSFFYAGDVIDPRQALQRCWLDVDAGAALDAVDDYGDGDGGGNGFVMLIEAFLRGLVVVRGDGEDAVGAQGFQVTSELDYICGVVAAGAGQDRDLAIRFFYCDFDYAQVFGPA